jgi:hypothetical protein
MIPPAISSNISMIIMIPFPSTLDGRQIEKAAAFETEITLYLDDDSCTKTPKVAFQV